MLLLVLLVLLAASRTEQCEHLSIARGNCFDLAVVECTLGCERRE